MVGNADPSLSSFGARVLAAACLAVPVTLASGCALLHRVTFEAPTVELAAVRIRALDLRGGTLDVALTVHNPNPYRIRGSQFEGEVLLEGTRFGAIAREAPWTFPASADTTLALGLTFEWTAMGAAARSVLDRGAVGYTLSGRLLVGTPADERWIRISRQGEVSLERPTR